MLLIVCAGYIISASDIMREKGFSKRRDLIREEIPPNFREGSWMGIELLYYTHIS